MWTYTGDPTASPKDEVRFLIGDTNSGSPQLQDAEIIYYITMVYGGLAYAPRIGNFLPAALAADSLAIKYAGMADKSVGDLHISHGQLFKNFQQMAARLRGRATNALVPIYSGGQSWAEKVSNYANRDIIPPAAIVDGMNFVTPTRTFGRSDDPSGR